MKYPAIPIRSLLSLLLAAMLLAACGDDHDIKTRIDAEWHRRTLEKDHLVHWLDVLPTDNGFFNTAVTRNWQKLDNQPGDIVSHARGIYVMAAGHELTGNPAYLKQVILGADFMLAHFKDKLHGGWVESVAPDGTIKNGNKRLYSQAFAIFALAHAYRAARDQRYLDAAVLTWQEIRLHFADAKGGFCAGKNRDFSQTLLENSQNPIMHLFEALVALHQASGSREAFDAAEGVGKFVAYELLEGLPDGSARIAELYDETWQPLPAKRGGRFDIGHQFEWAFLFSHAAEAGLNPIYAGVADRLLNYALANGYVLGEPGVIAAISPTGEANRHKGFWQQAEALRALMHHAATRGRSDLWGKVTQLTEFIDTEFIDQKNGGWQETGLSVCSKKTCPDRQPDAYHMTAMHQEALRLVTRVH